MTSKRNTGHPRYRIYVCGGDERLALGGDCPGAARHTPAPAGYLAWHEWAERMAETHGQSACPDCGRYLIWTPR